MATTQKVSPGQVLGALTTHPGATSAELAEVLGIGQSTAAKHLAALEGAGTARRAAGGREGGRRLADRWSTRAPAPDDTASDDTTAHDGGPEGSGDPTAADTTSGESTPSADRLGRGALGAMVREYLAARPGEELGPTQIGKALGRSQGAVSNALARLEAGGEARLVSASPRRYRIVESR